MMAPRIKGFLSLVEVLCEKVHSYFHYLNKQTERNEKVRFAQGPPEPNLKEFSSIQLKMKNSEIEADLETFRKLNCWTKCTYSPGLKRLLRENRSSPIQKIRPATEN